MRNTPTKLFIVFLLAIAVSSCSFDKSSSPTTSNIPTGSVPNTPTPANGSLNQFLYVTLKWECDNAAEYEVYIGETNPPLIKYTATTNKTYTTPLLKYNVQYFWRIVAKLNDGSSSAGPVWNFTTLPSSSTSGNGYALLLDKIETGVPHNVKVTFQVVDLSGTGVSTLNLSNFEVFEDYLPLSKTESELSVVNHSTVPNQIRTVLMLDNSTSVQTDIDKIKTSAKAIVNGIRPNQEIAVFAFSDKVYLLQDFTNDVNFLVNAIDNNFTAGVKSTDFYGAVESGTSLWNDEFSITKMLQGCMVIISDGNDTQGSSTLADAMHAVHNKLVFTIGLGSEIQPEILNALGTAGSFRIGQENEITKKFTELEQSLIKTANSFYDLSYKSPKRGNSDHTLQIRIIDNQYTGDRSTIFTTFSSADFTN